MIKNTTTTPEMKLGRDLQAGDVVYTGDLNGFHNIYKIVKHGGQRWKNVVGGSYKDGLQGSFAIADRQFYKVADESLVGVWNNPRIA